MFARVAWGKVKPGSWQEYEQIYHDEILPETRTVRGLVFRELLQGVDDPNEGISLTLWESRADLDAYEQSDLYQRIVDHAVVLRRGVLGQALRRAAGRGAQALTCRPTPASRNGAARPRC
jgi:heme-degrading monooxygenase HmoA